ncbi:hypothetical protein GCM10007939_18430 [Amylibacter marinus]|uniref:Phosphoribosyltransferase domain-containing protein n=2 Tax=Amylibacter marinus TaxID=1475483 RepID=A0ABQ5VWB2_9RHOB|nr:hypothetical protein GCM10007939_18430 [Amylibacter marinus]
MIGEQDDIPCEECLAHPRNWAQGRAAVVYAGGGQRIVLALKHGDRLDLAKPIGRWMAKAADDLPPADIIAPVPLHWTRLIKRRFNQAALLAQQVSRHSNTPMIPDLLTRSKRTKAQKDMDRTERIANMSAAIDITHRFKERIKGQEVLLVDDVMTTGATLSACAQACLGAGAKNVNVLVFARVAPIQ